MRGTYSLPNIKGLSNTTGGLIMSCLVCAHSNSTSLNDEFSVESVGVNIKGLSNTTGGLIMSCLVCAHSNSTSLNDEFSVESVG